MLKVVSFDVGGTLVDYYYLEYVWNEVIPQLYAKKEGINPRVAKGYVLREYDLIGVNDIRWYLPEYWFKRFNLIEDPMEVFRAHIDKIRFYPEVYSVLKVLSHKYELIVASNIPTSIVEIILGKHRNFFRRLFSPVSDLNEVKKTAKFYEMICKTLKVRASDMAHVGDDWHSDFVIPRIQGIRAFFLNRTKMEKGKYFIKDLRELEDLMASLAS